jgi:site-specific recombinase XerD
LYPFLARRKACVASSHFLVIISCRLRNYNSKQTALPTAFAIFKQTENRPLSWAHVNPDKVFPHNLRHLFARTFYKLEKDIAKLTDILGHSSINTTRIYIISTGCEHLKRMENMRLVV